MKKNNSTLVVALILVGIIAGIYFSMMPQWTSNNTSLDAFSVPKALEHIKTISEKPHYVGSENHEVVAQYLVSELHKLGLSTQIQEGTTLTEWGNLVKSKNIIARLPGTENSKALLLLSHYDSAPHSYSHGASDDASGVATILEGLRAFIYAKTPHKNDIIVLFSDAEELGLNGAALFVTQHRWAKDIGLAINFEARGTGGPSYMLLEVNKGNAAMVEGFKKANPDYPVSNSLMYSIYKMLPNDTDLTVFRKQGKIPGFNFAFIDNHFNYHTAQDDLSHVSPTTIAHQGSYLIPLLKYFSQADLTQLNVTEDEVYFNTPFYFVSYPFSWIIPMWIGAFVFFLLLLLIGLGKRILKSAEILKGFIPLVVILILAGSCNYFGWKLLVYFYPQYQDILQGFTYNGHAYIAAFLFLNLAIGFFVYSKTKTDTLLLNQSIAPLFIWILINLVIALYLPGASFFIIPVFFGLLTLSYFVITQKTNLFVNLILAVPALVIFVPFIVQFPVGLGLKILIGTAVLTLLVFGLLLPFFGSFSNKPKWSVLMLALSIGFFAFAHFNSGYQNSQAKPNSLVYFLNQDTHHAYWATYDVNLDYWTKSYLGDNPSVAKEVNEYPLFSKYHTAFTYSAAAPVKNIAGPTIDFVKDSTAGAFRFLKIVITPNRPVNRFDIFADEKMSLYNLKANKTIGLNQKEALYSRTDKKLLSYYVVNNEPLELQFSMPIQEVFNMSLMESSFDLLNNSVFTIKKRASWMMPTPFVLTDAVVLFEKIRPSPPKTAPNATKAAILPLTKKDSLSQTIDSLKTK